MTRDLCAPNTAGPSNGDANRRRWLLAILAIILLPLGWFLINVARDWREHEKEDRLSTCNSNLFVLYQLLNEYADTHNDAYPVNLVDALGACADRASPSFLVCPASPYIAASAGTDQGIDESKHCSYRYFASGKTRAEMAGRLILCEKGAFHWERQYLCVVGGRGVMRLSDAGTKNRDASSSP